MHDLKPSSKINIIFKYADDTNLLVPENTDVRFYDEFLAVNNKMIIIICKAKEIAIRRPNAHLEICLLPLPRIDLIEEAKLVDIMFTIRLHFESHVKFILEMCSQRF